MLFFPSNGMCTLVGQVCRPSQEGTLVLGNQSRIQGGNRDLAIVSLPESVRELLLRIGGVDFGRVDLLPDD